MSNTKVPALVKRLVVALVDLGYTLEEAQDMISNEGAKRIAEFVQGELEYAAQQQKPQETTKVTVTPSEDKSMALVIEHNEDGTKKSVRTMDTGYGVQSARPLPAVNKEAKPTVVEPAVQISIKPTPNEQAPKQELVYKFSTLPADMQQLVEQITIYGMPLTLPVCDVVGFSGEGGDYRPILKVRSGQEQINAYNWLILTDAKAWQNLPMLVVFPTDPDNLRRAREYYSRPDYRASQATFSLTCVSVVRLLNTYDFSQHSAVVATPASETKATAKVAAKARKADAKAEAEAPAKKEPVTEQLLSELACATNHMKKVSLVNKVLTALGEPKVASKITKVELQPTIERLLKTLGVAPVKEEKAPAKAKAKAAKEPKLKAPTKAAIEAFYVEQLVRETGCTEASAKKQFKGVDVKWTSSIERAEYAQNLGMTLEVA